ncbi:MAG: SpoIIE family protein phosphatase [Chlorobi bacterium]|nr:SpoIIE family protein phosphatase [Chlorobiota bacterium]
MNSKRKSLFNILLTRVLLTVLLFNIVIAVVSINETITLQRENQKILKEKIQDEIISFTKFQTSALESIAKQLVSKQFEILQKLNNLQVKQDLKYVDLTKFFNLYDLDSAYDALYIIENGIIVNTTFKTDLNLNFYNLGQDYRNFLLNIQEQDDLFSLGFAFEYRTKKLRAYSYYPTTDKKYLIEIGSYSETTNKILQLFKNRLTEIVQYNKDIVSLNLWIKDQNTNFPFIDNSYNIFTVDSIITEVFKTKTDHSEYFILNEKNYQIESFYIKTKDHSFIPEFTITLITDQTNKNLPVWHIIKRQLIFTVLIIVLLLLIIILITKKFKLVLNDLLTKTTLISKGNLSERVQIVGNNELTTLAEQFNSMVEKLEKSYSDLKLSNNMIKENMSLLKQQTDDIVESITYAKRIQKAVLPNDSLLDEIIPDRFIIFKPRDMVSGDFYWVKRIKNIKIIVAADCTGHGVPGAFMSMLGVSILNEIVSKSHVDTAGEILTNLRMKLKKILHQKGVARETKDGMDMAICVIDSESNILQYAGAFNPLYIFRNKELIEIKADRMPVGIYILEKPMFTNHEIQLIKNDTLFIFSDGFADQIGGAENKKFMIKNLKGLLSEHSHKPMLAQKEIYETTLDNWKNDQPQIDDILLIGFRV